MSSKGRESERKVCGFNFEEFITSVIISVKFSLVTLTHGSVFFFSFFIEGRRETKGEGKRKNTEHRSLYGGAEA